MIGIILNRSKYHCNYEYDNVFTYRLLNFSLFLINFSCVQKFNNDKMYETKNTLHVSYEIFPSIEYYCWN